VLTWTIKFYLRSQRLISSGNGHVTRK